VGTAYIAKKYERTDSNQRKKRLVHRSKVNNEVKYAAQTGVDDGTAFTELQELLDKSLITY
jgi:hypothetical protein